MLNISVGDQQQFGDAEVPDELPDRVPVLPPALSTGTSTLPKEKVSRIIFLTLPDLLRAHKKYLPKF